MLWLSADLASKTPTGLALWRGSELLRTAVLRPVGAAGKVRLGGTVYATEMAAWLAAFCAPAPLDERPQVLVAESVHVATHNGRPLVAPALALSAMHGRVGAWWLATAPERRPMVEVDVNTWRSVVREHLSNGKLAARAWSWPKKGEDCKPVAQALVREHYGREVSEDEADAVLVGVWALRTRAVEV